MGCDIHLFGEKKVYPYNDKSKYIWISVDKWFQEDDFDNPCMEVVRSERIYTDGRNYNLFCALAGVRNYRFNGEPEHFPEKGIPQDASRLVLDKIKQWEGDGHTHSYLTLKELKEFDWSSYGQTCDKFKKEVFEKLETLKGDLEDDDIRIVFFFDN